MPGDPVALIPEAELADENMPSDIALGCTSAGIYSELSAPGDDG